MTNIVLIRTTRRSNASVMGATFGFRFSENAKAFLMPYLTGLESEFEHIVSMHNYQLVTETLLLHSALSVYKGGIC